MNAQTSPLSLVHPSPALLGVSAAVLALAWATYQAYAAWLGKVSILGDFDTVGAPRQGQRYSGTAVVAGGSIAGMLAARTLADHFERVVVVEPEKVSTDPSVKRTRVMQWDQLHVFMPAFAAGLSKVLPTAEQDLTKAGGVMDTPPHQMACSRFGGFAYYTERFIPSLSIDRETLEAVIRRLVSAARPNINDVQATVTGVKLDATKDRVTQVDLRHADGRIESMVCALLVDATGPTCSGIHWLAKHGIASPARQIYSPEIRYTTFDLPYTAATAARIDAEAGEPKPFSQMGLIHGHFEEDDNFGVGLIHISGSRVRATVWSTPLNDPKLETVEDLHVLCDTFPMLPRSRKTISILFDGLKATAEPSPQPRRVSLGNCYRVLYDGKGLPANLCPVGDSILRLNPLFGQGCSKGLIDAFSLDRVLRGSGPRKLDGGVQDDFSTAYLDVHNARTEGMWDSTRIIDYEFESCKVADGDSREKGAGQRKLIKWIFRAGNKDQSGEVGSYTLEVFGMLRSPLALFNPVFLARCAWAHATGVVSPVAKSTVLRTRA